MPHAVEGLRVIGAVALGAVTGLVLAVLRFLES